MEGQLVVVPAQLVSEFHFPSDLEMGPFETLLGDEPAVDFAFIGGVLDISKRAAPFFSAVDVDLPSGVMVENRERCPGGSDGVEAWGNRRVVVLF